MTKNFSLLLLCFAVAITGVSITGCGPAENVVLEGPSDEERAAEEVDLMGDDGASLPTIDQ
ncbi:MAG: hypothetical protein AAFP69_08295 [Planctomycetota bacterium]